MTENSENLRRELDAAYRQLEQTASRLLLVNQAGMLTTSTHDPRVIARELLASILDSVFTRRGLVIIYSRGGAVFDVLAHQGLEEAEVDAFARSESEATALWISSLRKGPVTRAEILSTGEWEASLPEPEGAVYLPLLIEDELVGALMVGDKTTGEEYDRGELSFLANLGHHAAVALNHATLYNQLEKKLRDLDTLLKISQEITSTLDLDRILKTITTMASALSELEYCAIGLTRGGRLKIDSIGGTAPSKEEQESLRSLMEFVSLAGTEISATVADLPEGEGRDLFRDHFESSETGGFWGLPLKDDQGVMGTYCQLRRKGTPADEEQELLRILGNQASVAIRNAELYNQVPLIGFLEPLLEKRRRLWEAGRKKWKTAAVWTIVAAALLLLVRLPYRTGGDAVVFPGQRLQLRTPVAGIVDEVTALEGEVVGPGRPAGRILSLSAEMEYRDLQNSLERARREEAAARARGDLFAAQLAETDREALTAQLALLRRELEAATIAPPFPAVILTPHVEERKGDYLASGDVFCEVGTLDSLRIEIALPEKDWHAVRLGQRTKMKFYAYAERTFEGRVDILAPAALNRLDGKRVLIATVRIPAPGGVRPGMNGVGKVYLGRRSLLWFVARPFVRFVALRLWF